MDAAVGYIVRLQEHAGLDVVTDGEWRRRSYNGVIAELAHGFDRLHRRLVVRNAPLRRSPVWPETKVHAFPD